jgi:hypothetical protein
MNYDKYNIKELFGAQVSNFCRNRICEKAGAKVYDFDLEEEVWSMADSVMESMNKIIDNHLATQIPSWKD